MDKSIPMYQRIKHDIKYEIETGRLLPGEKIMSEAQLQNRYATSRITVTRALNDLVLEGLIRREKGDGSYVKRNSLREGVLELTSFAERMRSFGYRVKSEVLSLGEVKTPAHIIGLIEGDVPATLTLLKRLRVVEGEPFCLSFSYLNPAVFPWIYSEDLRDSSIYNLLEKKYNKCLGNGVQHIGVDFLSKADAAYLRSTETTPCLRLSNIAYLTDHSFVEFCATYYRHDRYEYTMNLKRHLVNTGEDEPR